MTEEFKLPVHVENFIIEHINSLSELELLFQFFIFPEKEWTPKTLSSELRSNISNTARIISIFEKKGFVILVNQDTFIANVKSKYRETINELNQNFNQRQSLIIGLIYEKTSGKLKGFSDAFKFKKE